MANARPGPRGGGSGFIRKRGTREMKEYPVTSRELWTLGGLQAGSAFALGFAGWLASFWVSAREALDLASKDTPQQILGQWQAYADMAWYGMVGGGILAALLIGLSGLNVWGIIYDTKHYE